MIEVLKDGNIRVLINSNKNIVKIKDYNLLELYKTILVPTGDIIEYGFIYNSENFIISKESFFSILNILNEKKIYKEINNSFYCEDLYKDYWFYIHYYDDVQISKTFDLTNKIKYYEVIFPDVIDLISKESFDFIYKHSFKK